MAAVAVLALGLIGIGIHAAVVALHVPPGFGGAADPGACTISRATGAGRAARTLYVGAPSGDMTAAINQTLGGAGPHARVVLSSAAGVSGRYEVSGTITVPSGVDLTGLGESATALVETSTTYDGDRSLVETGAGASDVTIQGMTLDGDGSANAASDGPSQQVRGEVDLTGGGSNLLLQHVRILDPHSYEVIVGGAGGAGSDVSRYCVRDNTIEDTDSLPGTQSSGEHNIDGIHINDSNDGDVVDNYVDNMAAYEGPSQAGGGGDDGIVVLADATASDGTMITKDIDIRGNVVRGGASSGGFDLATANGAGESGISISGNEAWGSPIGFRAQNFGSGGRVAATLTDNFAHDQAATPGNQDDGAETGTAYAFPAFGVSLPMNVTITGFRYCGTRHPPVVAGSNSTASSGRAAGVTWRGVDSYTGCSAAASTTSPPPAYPRGR